MKNIEGSHHRYEKAGRRATVKHPRKDVPCKTFQSILRQSGLCKEDFYI
ncbi:MAG: type II toxin-antitoxin system HicA family toxin [Candidatus Eremiobacterota bacterium]